MSKMSTQTEFLEIARKNRTPMSVITTNGFQMAGIITDFDDYVILFKPDIGGGEHMIYKSAISTIRPAGSRPTYNKDNTTKN